MPQKGTKGTKIIDNERSDQTKEENNSSGFLKCLICLFGVVFSDSLIAASSFPATNLKLILKHLQEFSSAGTNKEVLGLCFFLLLLVGSVTTLYFFAVRNILLGTRDLPKNGLPTRVLVTFLVLLLTFLFPGSYCDLLPWEDDFSLTLPMVFGVFRNMAALALVFQLGLFTPPIIVKFGASFRNLVLESSFNSVFIIVGFLFLVQVLVISHGFLGAIPHVQDEILQDWQARFFSAGKLFPEGFPDTGFFKTIFTAVGDGRIVQQYPPGWSALLALGHFLGVPWIINPLVGMTILFLLGWLAKETWNETFGKVSLILGAFCPFLIMQSASYMNHPSVVLAFLLSLFCLYKISISPVIFGTFLGGTVAWSNAIRPLDGGFIAIVIFFLLLGKFPRDRTPLRGLIGALFGFLAVTGLNLLYNQAVTGTPFLIPYEFVWSDQISFSFGSPNPFSNSKHSIQKAFINLIDNLSNFGCFLYGGFFPGIVFLFGGCFFLWFNTTKAVAAEATRTEHLFKPPTSASVGNDSIPILKASLVLAGMTLFWTFTYCFQDICFGPRFLFCFLPFGIWIGSRSFVIMYEGYEINTNIRLWAILGINVIFSITFTFPLMGFGILGYNYWGNSATQVNFTPGSPGRPSIVFLVDQTRAFDKCLAKMALIGVDQALLSRLHTLYKTDWKKLDKSLDSLATHSPDLWPSSGKFSMKLLQPRSSIEPDNTDLPITNGYEIFRSSTLYPRENLFLCVPDLGNAWNARLLSQYPDIPAWKAFYAGSPSGLSFERLRDSPHPGVATDGGLLKEVPVRDNPRHY